MVTPTSDNAASTPGRDPSVSRAAYVRRPRVSPDSQALGLDRTQLGALVAAARGSSPMDAALITLLGLLGLRILEACSVDLEDFGVERGDRTLHIIGKGGKPALLPLPPPVARTLDLAADERTTGPLLLTSTGRRMDRYAATRAVQRLAKKAGIAHHIGCHSLRHSYLTAALDAGIPLRDVQIAARHADPRTTTATTAPAATSTATPTTSSPPSSPAAPDRAAQERCH